MEFNISSQDFIKALSSVQSTIGKRTTMPILSFISLEAGGDEITITATDLEQTVISKVKADITKPGAVAVSSKMLFEIVRNLPHLAINITTTDTHQVVIKCGSGVYRLLGISNEEFPEITKDSKIKFAKIDNLVLADLLKRVLFTVSNDETKQHLRGVLFELDKDEQLRLVSTDGHRLGMSCNVVKGISKTGIKGGIVVPGKSLRELQKFLENEGEGKGELGFSGAQLCYNGNNISFTVRLQESNFPDYKVVIPEGNDKKPILDRDIFVETLKRVSILSSEMYNRVQLTFDKDKLEIIAVNEDVGEAKEELPMKYDDEKLVIGFNAKYLIDALSAVPTEEIMLELTDDASAAVVKGVDSDSYLCVIMPMRM